MSATGNTIKIIVTDDDPDDRLLIEEALQETGLDHEIDFFSDGLDLLDYLYNRGKYADQKLTMFPSLLILDLNMPRMDGRDALRQIKRDSRYRRLPVVVFTTSSSEEDVLTAYDLGVNSFITKPATFQNLVKVMESIAGYWLGTVALPTE